LINIFALGMNRQFSKLLYAPLVAVPISAALAAREADKGSTWVGEWETETTRVDWSNRMRWVRVR
jgi:hypothetical protein